MLFLRRYKQKTNNNYYIHYKKSGMSQLCVGSCPIGWNGSLFEASENPFVSPSFLSSDLSINSRGRNNGSLFEASENPFVSPSFISSDLSINSRGRRSRESAVTKMQISKGITTFLNIAILDINLSNPGFMTASSCILLDG